MSTIKGYADGLEADPVWETPLPAGDADTVAAILEAVREDWRHSPAPASGYRLDLAYDTDTGAMDITMGPADPNEEPPGGLIAPLPFRHATMSDYWPEGPFDHEAAADALAADLRANGVNPDKYRIPYGPPVPYEPTREEHQP